MPKHILVAHDLSVEADVAVRRAAQLAAAHDASVTLLHVIEEYFPQPMLDTAREAAEIALRDSAISAGLEPNRLLVRQGRAAAVIVATCGELNADLLVLGTHHQQLLERFEGTTLEQVIRHCRVPALLAVDPAMQPYQRALSALDFSVGACNAWRGACELLDAGAQLLSLHAYSPGREASTHLEEQQALLEQLIRDEAGQCPGPLPQCQCRISREPIGDALQRAIEEYRPQLLVLGSRGRNALQRALLGSTARYYLRRPPCDLLVSA
ncbi:universal stress protein [Pseudomonas citronellolis]|uniref:universal stress protein n=1 Tax=Pseudomonas citronellolis TaxID=53408 RepID=UPI0023E45A0E|nr:universal stress protein [Pseudomonas citronellolis]MDF3936480.1 universal stress protein [Pseudomonas citronellolis]